MSDHGEPKQSFPPLETVCKHRFPFTVACPSFVYPADYVDNVRHLAPFVDEIQLLFFESHPQSIPSPELIRELADLAIGETITYNVHLPSDLYAGHPDPAERRRAADVTRMVLERCAPLAASTFTVHLNRNPQGVAVLPMDRWQAYILDTLEHMLPADIDHRRISVETLDYPIEQVAPVIASADLSICMDMGHLMVHGVDIETFFARWQERISIVHLHGVDGARDHLPLDRLSENHTRTVLDILERFGGVVCLEVYSYPGLNASLAHLAKQCSGLETDTGRPKKNK